MSEGMPAEVGRDGVTIRGLEDTRAAVRGDDAFPPNGLFVGPPDDPRRYELLGPGMTGGEGTTWRARYRGTLRGPLPFAVKMLRPPPRASDWPTDADRRRWQDQTALLRHLENRHVVRVDHTFVGSVPHTGRPTSSVAGYVVMEWVDGRTLEAEVEAEADPHTLTRRVSYVEDVADAVSALHSMSRTRGNPSLHRDLKPSNCLLHPDRGVVLVDMTSMRTLADGIDPQGLHTPAYTAPEVRAAPVRPRDVAADLYALGALTVFVLLGEEPSLRTDESQSATLRSRLVAVLERCRVVATEQAADHVLALLDPDPQARPTNARAWAQELRRLTLTAPAPSSRRRLALVAGAGALVIAAGGTTWAIARSQASPSSPSTSASRVTSAPTVGTRPTPAPSVSSGDIAAPSEHALVKQCAYMSGSARLAASTTLVLAMRNLDNGDAHRYVQFVFGWRHPEALSNWRGAQYFGEGDGSVGQHYQVDLVAVPLAAAESAKNSDTLATAGPVLDTVTVTRIAGKGPGGDCPGP